MTSKIKTAILFAVLTALLVAIGGAIGGRQGLMIALVMAIAMNFFSYWFSDRIVLSMYRAQELAEEDAPQLHHMIGELAYNAGIPKPRVYLVPDPSPNAFATGRDPQHAAVAVTQGIMQLLNPEELRGVLAHEMAHVLNRDILIQSCASIMGAAITYLANMFYFASLFGGRDREEGGMGSALGGIAMMILGPIAASLIQMAISRSREFLADETGARLCGQPLALANALERLTTYSQRIPMNNPNPATESMFIVSPLTGGTLQNLFSTHPPMEERIRRLHEMAGGYQA